MSEQLELVARRSALQCLRAATGDLHRRLEDRLQAVERLSDPDSRTELIGRYAALHLPADAALADELEPIAGLEFGSRCRTPMLRDLSGPGPLPMFPRPFSRAEALGMLYVLEGSTLGGRMILRELSRLGVSDRRLRFLDPYGGATGERWRSFLDVLDREVGSDPVRLDDVARGGVRGFRHAHAVLCGEAA